MPHANRPPEKPKRQDSLDDMRNRDKADIVELTASRLAALKLDIAGKKQ